jgi:hypothetical protein
MKLSSEGSISGESEKVEYMPGDAFFRLLTDTKLTF